MREWQLNFDLN